MVRPAFASALVVAGIGPVEHRTGSTPARAKVWKRARGVRPSSLAFSSLMISAADAPSQICELLPAVTLPSGWNAGFRLASVSAVVPGRMPSSPVCIDVEDLDLAGLLVADLGHDRDDLVVEAALVGGALGARLGLGAEARRGPRG